MKFSEMKYSRPDLEQLKQSFNALLTRFENSGSASEQIEIMNQITQLRSQYHTHQFLAHIRFTQDTNNEKYKAEKSFFDQANPEFEGLENAMQRTLLNSGFRSELEDHFGKHLFNLYETHVITYNKDIEKDLTEENQLKNAYTRLMASAEIPFRGKTYNISGINAVMNDPDREVRKEAYQAKFNFMHENSAELDELYDQLVKTRHNIARKLGFENFIPVAYARLERTDYGPDEVERFRENIEKLIVPIATKLRKKQQRWLDLDSLKFYDEPLKFPSGNPTPKGDRKWIVNKAAQMYNELSPETEEFFTFMRDNELMDLDNRSGKAGGGYCTFLPEYGTPFIFANFNGTSGDVKVLTHEIGHAFQLYCSRNKPLLEYLRPTLDAAEIHSMSMEYLTLPWMKKFFKDDKEKFIYKMLSDQLQFLPYGVAVDEFQHYVYENPHASPEMRKKKWKEMERKYLPHRKYDGEPFLENGGYWQIQQHIYNTPFYYIDYTLAAICAMQFWIRAKENHSQAVEDYISLCNAGGSRPFTELVEQANLISPFGEEAIKDITGSLEQWLKNLDEARVF